MGEIFVAPSFHRYANDMLAFFFFFFIVYFLRKFSKIIYSQIIREKRTFLRTIDYSFHLVTRRPTLTLTNSFGPPTRIVGSIECEDGTGTDDGTYENGALGRREEGWERLKWERAGRRYNPALTSSICVSRFGNDARDFAPEKVTLVS